MRLVYQECASRSLDAGQTLLIQTDLVTTPKKQENEVPIINQGFSVTEITLVWRWGTLSRQNFQRNHIKAEI
jgi:hypothetical protein